MCRIVALLVALACLSPHASASVVPPKEPLLRLEKKAKPPIQAARAAKTARSAPDSVFVITPRSKIKLNGRPCSFKDIPADAVITNIEVDPDTKAILTIEFSSGK